MKTSLLCLTAVAFAAIGAFWAGPAIAGIAWSDDVLPEDPATWTSGTDSFVGKTGTGSMTIDGGDDILSRSGSVAYGDGSSGTATITGDGSSWTCGNYCHVGQSGSGSLNIKAGAIVSDKYGYIGSNATGVGVLTVNGPNSTWSNSNDTYVGRYGNGTLYVQAGATVECLTKCRIAYESNSTGLATVTGDDSTLTCASLELGNSAASSSATLNIADGGAVVVTGAATVYCCDDSSMMINFDGGSLTAQTLYAPAAQLAGTGAIDARGIMGDVNLVFNSPASLVQSFKFDDLPDQDITVTLDVSNPADVGSLGVGFHGNGSVTIQNAVEVNSLSAHVAFDSGSTATATVTGAGSKWITGSGDFYVGDKGGNGALNVADGAAVSSNKGYVGNGTGSTGVATVSDSTWNNSSYLYVGNQGGAGTLHITNGSTVTSSRGYIGYAASSSGTTTGTATVSGPDSSWNGNSMIYVGGYQGGDGTLTIENCGATAATYLSLGYNAGSKGTVNLINGGTLAVNRIMGSTGEETVNFDGGILKAFNAAGAAWLTPGTGACNVYIKKSGAIFDTNGYDMGIVAALQHGADVAVDGGATKSGAGSLTLSGANNYNGLTTVAEGKLILGASAHNAVFTLGGADVRGAGILVFDYAGGSTPIATVRDSLFSGKIYSSDATASHGLGYADDGSAQVTIQYAVYGDADLDGDVDVNDLMNAYGNYTGTGGTGKIWASSDCDYDGDVDVNDLMNAYGNYTGTIQTTTLIATSGNPGIADLIYDPATGNVRLDACEANDGIITGFSLENAVGGDDFNTGVVDFPFATFQDDLPTVIANFDMSGAGFSGVWDLGNIFVAGLDEASLSAWLTRATYSSTLGAPVQTFDFIVVPEPGTLVLLAGGLLGLLARAWRKRR